MSMLNNDVLFLILEELQNDRKSLHSCLLVDRTWCEATVPFLWENPLKICPPNNSARNILLNVILLHLSEESKEILKDQEIDLFMEIHKRPLFNYINFWRYLNLHLLKRLIVSAENITKISTIINEIMKLFINRNTMFTHLYSNTHDQIHLIPGAKHCFSKLKFFCCDKYYNINEVLEGLSRISKSIEILVIHIDNCCYNISEIIKLIKAQKNLKDVRFTCQYHVENEQFRKALEESLIKHVDTIQYLQIGWKPITKILLNLVNLTSLDINLEHDNNVINVNLNCSNLENVSLPVLKILKARCVPTKSLARLIENIKGDLVEVNISRHYGDDERLIQVIYRNCPNLKYFGFEINAVFNSFFSEFDKLLINCQCLNGLVISGFGFYQWDNLFESLVKSSPSGLFKFKFRFKWRIPVIDSLKSFFDGWKGRHPMLLQAISTEHATMMNMKEWFHLIEKCKAEGIIKKYGELNNFEDFEWIKKKKFLID